MLKDAAYGPGGHHHPPCGVGIASSPYTRIGVSGCLNAGARRARALGETMAVTSSSATRTACRCRSLAPHHDLPALARHQFPKSVGDLYSPLADRSAHPLRHHLHRAGDCQAAAIPGCSASAGKPFHDGRLARRLVVNILVIAPLVRSSPLIPASFFFLFFFVLFLYPFPSSPSSAPSSPL